MYRGSRPGEQYCYVDVTLTFGEATRIEWITRTGTRYRDANDEEDQGNIDYLNPRARRIPPRRRLGRSASERLTLPPSACCRTPEPSAWAGR